MDKIIADIITREPRQGDSENVYDFLNPSESADFYSTLFNAVQTAEKPEYYDENKKKNLLILDFRK